jgi:hypothetical protein
MWTDALGSNLRYFSLLSQHMSGATEENHEGHQSIQPVSRPKFVSGISRIRSGCATHYTHWYPIFGMNWWWAVSLQAYSHSTPQPGECRISHQSLIYLRWKPQWQSPVISPTYGIKKITFSGMWRRVFLVGSPRWFFARGFFYPEEGGDTFLRKVSFHKKYTAPHPRKRHYS